MTLEYWEPPEFFYIQNRGYCGNCMLFWRAGGNGYTCNLDDAGRFSREEAECIVSQRQGQDAAHPVSLLDRIAQRHVSIEELRAVQRKAEAPDTISRMAAPENEASLSMDWEMDEE